jgi:hypothetical protein
MEPYCVFFETFKPNQDEYSQADLKGLYKFSRKIKASMKWMEYLEDPIAIIMNSVWLAPSDAHARVA